MQLKHKILSIAGSDSGGGAGIQADIKTITSLGGYAMTTVTAITAQNTLGVRDIHPVPLDAIAAQLGAVFDDLMPDAIKIGMLHNAEVVALVRDAMLQHATQIPIVLDPVMVATSGDRLLDMDALDALTDFFPHVTLITPNIPEAELLLNHEIRTLEGQKNAAHMLQQNYGCAVLLKGGHMGNGENGMSDILCMGAEPAEQYDTTYVETKHTHGTGCTLSSAVATFLGQGASMSDAVQRAQRYVHNAIAHAPNFGSGHGPINHSFGLHMANEE